MPAQWEGKLEDGRMIYIRYRHGYLSIRVSPAPSDDIMDAVGAKEIYGELIGNGADGDMEECELISITKHILQYPSFIEDQWGAK